MMNNKIAFRELCQLMENLGFSRNSQPTHVLFEHAPSDSFVVLRPYTARELVNVVDLAVVRKTLDERGLMSAEAFERFMAKKSA